MRHTYRTRGTCSRGITFDIEDGILKNIRFDGGCHGNTQGVALLAEGMPAAEVAKRLRGVDCRGRGTSCPDQLAQAILEALEQSV